MSLRFCTQCGAKLLPDARYCAECGLAIAGTSAAAAAHRRPFERWAPVLIVGTVIAVGAVAVLTGVYVAPPPNVPPPRQAAAGNPQQPMPQNHPPVEVPDDVRKVITKLADAAKEHPDDMQAWQQLGFVQYRAGQVDPTYLAEADATYAHILEREPENLDSLRARGNIAFDRNDPGKAMEFYRSYLRLKPDDLSVQTDLGTMLLSMQQVDAAMKAYKDVLAVDPKFFQAQFNLAIAYRAAGDDAQALAAMERAREVADDDATRKRVDDLLARLKGAPAEAAGAPSGGGLRADVEQIFRGHPIVGAKIDRIEWPSDERVRVVLREFPMDGMPPMVREKFTERIRTGLRDSAARNQVAAGPTAELVDAASGRVMNTIAAAPSTGAGAAAPPQVAAGGAAAPPAAAPPAPPGSGDLHTDIESVFRAHPIVAPKLDRIEWSSADRGRVLLKEFPMDAMPPMVRDKFTERIRTGIRDGKARAQTTAPITIELVDAATGHVMQTITE
jgi:cytochrome c-type biogenesis protein CcmH/NrfG